MPQPQPFPRSDETATDGIAAALGKIPSGLFVVSWRDGDHDRGMLASWVMQAGFEPPMIAIAIGTSRDLLAAIDKGVSFVVSVLAESQRGLLGRFGRPAAPGENPFTGIDIDRTGSGTAAIVQAAGWLECRAVAQAASGDHVVVVGQVTSAKAGGDEPPLVHLRRNGLRY